MAAKKTILIVFAHQDIHSFNGALLQTAVDTLQCQGHTVEVSDLYAQNFDPRATRQNCEAIANGESFSYNRESRKWVESGRLPADVSAEMAKLTRADLLIFQFPMYWSSMPAIMKGWMDKVLLDGFAHDFDTGQIFDNGLMKGRKACLSFTTGATANMYSDVGINGDINVTLWPMQSGLRFCGFDVLSPQMSFAPEFVSQASREQMLVAWQRRLNTIFEEDPIKFIPLKYFDAEQEYTLSASYKADANGSNVAPSVGQHMGKSLPSKKREGSSIE